MAQEIKRIAPTGNMDKDSDVRYVGKGNNAGDYLDAKNIQRVSENGNVQGSAEPTLGNTFAESLGEVFSQNKSYRIKLTGDAALNHQVKFLSTTRSRIITNGTGPGNEVEFNGTVAGCAAAIASSNNSGLFLVTTGGDFVDVTLTGYAMYQWYLESVGTDDVEVICTSEAIPTNLAGKLKDIGSYDLLGDLFIFSTTQDNEPTDSGLTIASVGPQSGGNYVGPITRITFTTAHGLEYGNWFRITGSDEPFLNGTFVVRTVVSPTEIDIVTDTAWGGVFLVTGLGSPTVTIHPNGIGEIGVAQKDEDADTWTYTRLLRSVELNFVSKYGIRSDAREKGGGRIIYYTDRYNVPRLFVHNGNNYVVDGALNYVNLENEYVYDFINDSSDLLSLSSSSYSNIEYVGQSDNGGALLSGNKYYLYRFLDQDNSPTAWSDPTRAIPVFPRSLTDDDAVTLKGGATGQDGLTSKTVSVSIQGIPQGLFSKIQVAVIEPSGDVGVSGLRFSESPLNGIQQEIVITHTGLETETETLDVGELAVSTASFNKISKVGDVVIIDKRLVMGDISYVRLEGLLDWTSQFTHRLDYGVIGGLRRLFDERVGGYVDPQNVHDYPSLILNETYRVGVSVTFKNGVVSPVFHVDDIKVDTSSINLGNPIDNRRIPNGGLPNYVLNDYTTNANIFVPHIVFSGINMDFLVDGVPIKDVISSITFRFSPVVKEVLASGFVIVGISGKKTINPVQLNSATSIIGMELGPEPGHHCQYLDWNGTFRPPVLGTPQTEWAFPENVRKEYPNGYVPERTSSFFYSPEISMGQLDDYQFTAADRLNVYYPMDRSLSDRTVLWNGAYVTSSGSAALNGPSSSSEFMLPSEICEMAARPPLTTSGQSIANTVNFNQYDLDEAEVMEAGQTRILDGVDIDTYHHESSVGIGTNVFLYKEFDVSHSKCLALRSSSDVYPSAHSYWSAEGVDYGMYYAQLFRETPGKYNEIESTEYQIYGQRFDASVVKNTETELSVYGGDAFTVKAMLRNRFVKEDQNISQVVTSSAVPSIGFIGRYLGMAYFAQSYINMELVNPDVETDPNLAFASFPESFTGTYSKRLRDWTELFGGEYKQFYNTQYSYGINSIQRSAFSEEEQDLVNDVPTRIVYSSRDIYSSIEDSMKVFLSLNIHDLDGTFGPIRVVENVNGELFTLQDRKWQIQAFNARGELTTSVDSVSVLLGSGDVMSQDGKTLSSYGTEHKWSVVKGRSSGGKDVLYWFNSENGTFMRFGGDGTVVLSDMRHFRSYAKKYTKWVEGEDSPAFEQGVRGVWDERSKEVIWTFIGWRQVDQWIEQIVFPYTQTILGTVIRNDNAPSDTYEEFPRFFRCIQSHVTSLQSEPGVGADWEDYWEQIPYTDPDYYSIFTVAHNELTNGFTTFYSHLPKTYLQWKDTFLSSHPVHRNLLFEHRLGEPTTWYGLPNYFGGAIAPKIEDAHVELVVNDTPEQSIKGVAINFLTDKVPDLVNYTTKRQTTYSEATDFDKRDDQFYAPIRGDVSQGQDPNMSETNLSGDYLRVKFTIFGGTYNLLHSIIVKVRSRMRRIIN